MEATLVNHAGTIQRKHIIKTVPQLIEYISEIHSQIVLSDFQEYLQGKENTVFEKRMAVLNCKPLEVVQESSIKLYETASKHIDKGFTLVFNEAGGFCFWSDDNMKIVSENESFLIKKTIVLENSASIEKEVLDYLTVNQITDYQLISNSKTYSAQEIFEIVSKSETIIFKTTATDLEQIENFKKLFKNLQTKKEIIVINSPNLLDLLSDLETIHEIKYI